MSSGCDRLVISQEYDSGKELTLKKGGEEWYV
jgi:hypothetical protein